MASFRFRRCLSLSLALFILRAFGAPTADANAACAALKTAYPASLAYTTDSTFASGREYWSGSAKDAGVPACIFYPTSALAVSDGIKVLLRYPSVQFAMKSGGHSPNPGFNNVDGGILFAFSSLASTVISTDRQTADVGPGARWGDVIKALEPYGKAVVGGRIAEVGVGGLLLGGGLSYLSAQYGFACDNVVNFEVVLANATIVNANANSNNDLFVALKGGGNQFGMVTKFTLRTVPIGQVWGGLRFYGKNELAAIINATHDFTSNLPDPKAAVIVNMAYVLTKGLDQANVFFFYDGPTPPPGVFAAFDARPAEISTTKPRSYADLLQESDPIVDFPPRTFFYDISYPSLPGDAGRTIYQKQYQQFRDQFSDFSTALSKGLVSASLNFQPWSRSYVEKGFARGGPNAIGANPAEGDKMYSIYQPVTEFKIQDKYSRAIGNTLVNNFANYYQSNYAGAVGTHAEPGVVGTLGPRYLNDAGPDQVVVQNYANYPALKATQSRYDPNGLFSKRTQGFKY